MHYWPNVNDGEATVSHAIMVGIVDYYALFCFVIYVCV